MGLSLFHFLCLTPLGLQKSPQMAIMSKIETTSKVSLKPTSRINLSTLDTAPSAPPPSAFLPPPLQLGKGQSLLYIQPCMTPAMEPPRTSKICHMGSWNAATTSKFCIHIRTLIPQLGKKLLSSNALDLWYIRTCRSVG